MATKKALQDTTQTDGFNRELSSRASQRRHAVKSHNNEIQFVPGQQHQSISRVSMLILASGQTRARCYAWPRGGGRGGGGGEHSVTGEKSISNLLGDIFGEVGLGNR